MITKSPGKKKIIIVGGGYVGALTAILFSQKQNLDVTIIEKQTRLGGLYNSEWSYENYNFDYGSRSIVETGIKDIDNLLFKILPENNYYSSKKNLNEFSFQKGKLREYTICLDARLLNQKEKDAGIEEIKSIKNLSFTSKKIKNLADFSIATYGKNLTYSLIKPAIEKLTGINITETDKNALSAHNIQRLIVADQETSKKLKAENEFNNNRFAFARYDDHKSDLIKMYPLNGGLKDFGDRILKYLMTKDNVSLKLGNSVINIISNKCRINKLELEDKTTINADEVIWTVPPIYLSNILNIDTSDLNSNEFRNLVLGHYLFEGSLKTEAHFTYNYEPNFNNYRTSFYQNYSNCLKSLNPITIESFSGQSKVNTDYYKSTLFNEMKEMGTISKDSKIIKCKIQVQPRAVPNFSLNFFQNQSELFSRLDNHFVNLNILTNLSGSKSMLQSSHKIFQHI